MRMYNQIKLIRLINTLEEIIMNENTKKLLTKIYSVLLILLAAALAAVSVLPVVTFDASKVEYEDEFYAGTFTANMDMPDKLELGLISVVEFVMNFSDAQTIATVQAGNETVDAEERERLAEKLEEDKGLANSVLLFYAFGGLVDDDGEEDLISQDDYGEMLIPIICNIFGIIMTVCLVLAGLIFPIILIIKFIILLVKSLKHLKDDTDEDVDKRMDKYPFVIYASMMFMFYLIRVVLAPGLGMGGAISGALIILIISSVLRCAKSYAFASKNEVVPMIIKQAITAVSLVAIIVVMTSFIGIALVDELNEAIPDMSKVKYELISNELLESGAREPYVTAKDKVSSINGIYAGVFVFVAVIAGVCIPVAVISAIERFGNKKTKMKTGEIASYKSMVYLAAFLLVLAIIPTLLATDSEEARDESYEKGIVKIWYTEYQEEGTPLNVKYELLKEFKEAGDEELAELREELKTAEGEKAEDIAEQIEEGEKMVAEAESEIKEIEARAKRPVICLISAVVFLISEIVYLVLPKILSKNKKEEEPAVEAESVE